MKKEIKYPLNGLIIGATVGFLYSILYQYLNKEEKKMPFWAKLNKEDLLIKSLIGAGIGTIAGYGYYKWIFYNESNLPFDTKKHLRVVLNNQKIKIGNSFGNRIMEEVIEFLYNTYKSKLAGFPLNWGSTSLGTAIKTNLDYDLMIPFTKASFDTLEDMYHDVFHTLKYNYRDAEIRKQKRSIGLTFFTVKGDVHIDIVPGREINKYKNDGELNLFEIGNFLNPSSRIKTNTILPKKLTANRWKELDVVCLIKIYRDRYDIDINSTFLQHLVLEAFNKKPPTNSREKNFLYALEYVSEKITYARIIDPGNSNNIISDKINYSSALKMAEQIESDLNKYSVNKNYLKEILPL